MSQCVPSWDIENQSPRRPPPPPRLSVRSHSNSTASDVPLYDYEVAELTWENGHVAMHGLGLPRKRPSWEKPRATGTLESIVNQATCTLPHQFSKPPFDNTHNTTITTSATDNLVTWFDHHRRVNTASCAPASHTVTMDALVPSTNSQPDEPSSSHMIGSVVSAPGVFGGSSGTAMINGCSTWVGSCSAVATHDENTRRLGKHAASATHVPTSPEWSSRSQSESGSATFGMDCQQVALDTKGSDHDSVCHSRLQREAGDDDERKKRCSTGKSSVSTKRSRAAAIHNQSERKRRDKINQRMKTLQKLVPNSSKTDKASMLDEVIEYLKQLQAQVHVISRMNMPPAMMLPMAMQQQLQMSMMAPRNMGMGIGMGMGLGLDMNSISRSNIAGVPPVLLPSAFMPAMASWDASASGAERLQAPSTAVMPDPMSAFLACQSQPMTMDAYSMMAAMYQQFHQQQPTASSSKS